MVMNLIARFVWTLSAVLVASEVRAQDDPIRTADKLPAFNVLCYRVIITNFSDEMAGQIVMGKADDHARFHLFTVDGMTLKVVNNPEELGLRQGYGRSASEVNVSPVKSPAKRPPVFSWQERPSFGLKVFSYEAAEKVLSIVTMVKPTKFMRAVHTNEVLTCRDK